MMTVVHRIGLGMAMAAWLASAGYATTYYVSVTGSDTNSGLTRASAWLTLQQAVGNVTPGDTVVVLAGTYAGARLERSGTRADPIVLTVDRGADVVLNRPGPANRRNSILEIETWTGDYVVSNWVVQGFVVTNAAAYGIDARSTRFVTVRNNTVIGSGISGIFAPFSYDITIQGNECRNNGEHGLYCNNSSDRVIVRGNRLHHNAHAGLHMNGDLTIPPPPASPWVQDGVMSGCLVEDNTIFQNGPDGAGINMDGVTRSIVRNNLLYDTPNNSGIVLFQGDGAVPSSDNWIVNNTIIMATNGGWAIALTHVGCTNNRVYNNIVYNEHSWRGSIQIATPEQPGFLCDYNVVMNRFSTDAGSSRIDLAAWRALGYGLHSIVATPATLFDGEHAYQLSSNSPAIDAGMRPVPVSRDMTGVSRPLDGDDDNVAVEDIGAFEYVHPCADTDGDRMRDAAEVIAGTDATNRTEYLGFVAPRRSGNGMVLAWTSQPDRFYSMVSGTTVTNMVVTVTNHVPATPPVNVYTVKVDSTVSRFYRVMVKKK